MERHPKEGRIILHYDENYIVWKSQTNDTISLGMVKRRLVLEFSHDEGEELIKTIVSIQIPDNVSESIILYDDGVYSFDTDGKTVRWYMKNRMVSVSWHIEDWRNFQDMISQWGVFEGGGPQILSMS